MERSREKGETDIVVLHWVWRQTEVCSFTRPSLTFCFRRGWPMSLGSPNPSQLNKLPTDIFH